MEKRERRFECSELPEGHYRAEAVLVGLTLLWGSTFTAVKVLLEQLSFSWLLAWRFGIATFFLSIYCLYRRVPIRAHHWRAGIPLSLYLFAGYLTQTIGLGSTTASKSSFITSMTVVLVPLASLLIEKRYPRLNSILGILLATVGLYLLVQPRGEGIASGDIWTFLCTITWAVYIVQLQIETQRHDNLSLLWVQMIGMTVLCLGAIPVEGLLLPGAVRGWIPSGQELWLLVYLSLGCTLVTTGMQTFFQKGTTSTRAALIFTAEPVFASAIAWIWLGETFTVMQFLGAGLIVGGVLAAELIPERRSLCGKACQEWNDA